MSSTYDITTFEVMDLGFDPGPSFLNLPERSAESCMNDMSDDSPPSPTVPLSSDIVPASLLSKQHMWPSIARDIALLSIPQSGSKVIDIEAIRKEYKLTEDDMLQLFKLPRFEHLLWNEMTRIQREGPSLGHKYWAEGMAVRMGEDIYSNLYQNVEARVQDKLKFFELLSQQANLIPKETKLSEPVVTNNATAQIAVKIEVPEGVTNAKVAHIRQSALDA